MEYLILRSFPYYILSSIEGVTEPIQSIGIIRRIFRYNNMFTKEQEILLQFIIEYIYFFYIYIFFIYIFYIYFFFLSFFFSYLSVTYQRWPLFPSLHHHWTCPPRERCPSYSSLSLSFAGSVFLLSLPRDVLAPRWLTERCRDPGFLK